MPRWVGPIAVLGILVVMTMAFGSAYWEGYRLRREAAELIREREQLRRENAQLREEVRLLNTPEYIERIAREQLGLVRPGEIAIMLVRATPAPAPTRRRTDQPSQRPPEHESWWIRLLQR